MTEMHVSRSALVELIVLQNQNKINGVGSLSILSASVKENKLMLTHLENPTTVPIGV
jgi:hypothetical protein